MEAITRTTDFQLAKRKARYGHREWIGYTIKSTGERIYERASAESLKRAMLLNGTQRHMTLIETDGLCSTGQWSFINRVRRQFLLGYRNAA